MLTVKPGDDVSITTTTSTGGVLTDVTSMSFWVLDNLGVETEYEYPGTSVSHTATGTYVLALTIPDATTSLGTWKVRSNTRSNLRGSSDYVPILVENVWE